MIDYRRTPDWPREVLALTGGRGADHVVDVVGGGNVARSVAAARIGGSISLIGFLDGTTGTLDLPDAFRRIVSLHAISVGSRDAFEALVAATEAAALEPVVDRVFAFDAFRDAYRHLAQAGHVGKIAIAME